MFLPHVDVKYAAQQVLGKHWRTATPEQQKRFVTPSTVHAHDLRHALLDFTGDRMRCCRSRAMRLRIAPLCAPRSSGRWADGCGQLTPCAGTQGGKVWDVVVEGISYVKSFREDYEVRSIAMARSAA